MINPKVLDEGSASNFYAYLKERASSGVFEIYFIHFLKIHFLAGYPIAQTIRNMDCKLHETFPLDPNEEFFFKLLVKISERIDKHLIPVDWHEKFSKELKSFKSVGSVLSIVETL